MGENSQITDLFTLPIVEEAKNKFDILLAMLVQNCKHDQNKDRTAAIEDGTYVEFLDDKTAYQFLKDQLSAKLNNKLLTLKSDLVK